MNDEHLHRACEAKDAGFDGWFFVGVTSTGIYCRASCPARTPKRENRRFFHTAAAARDAGFRACKRCHPDTTARSGSLTIELPYTPPFEGEELIAFLRTRAVPGVEEVLDGTYRRSLRLPHGTGLVAMRPAGGHVEATFDLDDARDLEPAIERCRALLDLDCDPLPIAEHLGRDGLIGAEVRRAPGRRVPGHVDPHELAIRAVLGQQVSLAGGRTLAGRMVAAADERLKRASGGVTHLFPSAEWIAETGAAQVGMPAARRAAITGLAGALASGAVDLDASDAQQQLLSLPGIGPWTVSYIAMRALRDADAFLATDLGIRKALQALGQDASPAAALKVSERWRPYRAAASQHLWATLTKPSAASVKQAA
ncbi:MAG TPA: AlkA N-terminal domain-containing protein [Thermoleophilaceae bacterium]|nr:AlkA N-terminal domain-containing protein [Thermoleophilaceae bacterium]